MQEGTFVQDMHCMENRTIGLCHFIHILRGIRPFLTVLDDETEIEQTCL